MKSQTANTPSLRPSSIQKRRAIINSALRAFIREGLHGANLDDIARDAGVSKQTLYSHFGNKSELFGHVVVEATSAAFEVAHIPVEVPKTHDDLQRYFLDYAKMLSNAVLTPSLIGLRRLVIREAQQFPELAESFYERGPKATQVEMAGRIRELHLRNLLNAPEPTQAASILNWLILAEPLNRAMMQASPVEERLALPVEHIEEAVRVFLAAYETKPT